MSDLQSDSKPLRFSLKGLLLIVTIAAVLAGFVHFGLEIYRHGENRAPSPPPPNTPPAKRPIHRHPLLPTDRISPI